MGREPERGEFDKTSSPQPSPPFSMEEREKKYEPFQGPVVGQSGFFGGASVLASRLVRSLAPPNWITTQHPKISSRSLQFIFSPVLAPNSLERSQPFSALPSFLLRAGACLGGLLLYYWIYWQLVNAFQLRGISSVISPLPPCCS